MFFTAILEHCINGGCFKCFILAIVIMDRETRRGRGFGFVTFATAGDAKKAIETLDGEVCIAKTSALKSARSCFKTVKLSSSHWKSSTCHLFGQFPV